jgi:hypothetical protein
MGPLALCPIVSTLSLHHRIDVNLDPIDVNVELIDVLAVPPYMEQLLIGKYKLKNNGPPVKAVLYMGERCEWWVQL